MKPDVIVPTIISAAPATAIAPTDTDPPTGQCMLCSQPLDPEPASHALDGMPDTMADDDPLVCTDCRVETTTRRREPPC